LQGLPVELRQREEILLTAALSVFAVAVLSSLSISVTEALLLFGLFWAQFLLGAIVPEEWHGVERIAMSVVYLLLAAWIFLRNRRTLPVLIRNGFRTPHADLRAAEE
jgi:cation:H+ antiporter